MCSQIGSTAATSHSIFHRVVTRKWVYMFRISPLLLLSVCCALLVLPFLVQFPAPRSPLYCVANLGLWAQGEREGSSRGARRDLKWRPKPFASRLDKPKSPPTSQSNQRETIQMHTQASFLSNRISLLKVRFSRVISTDNLIVKKGGIILRLMAGKGKSRPKRVLAVPR